MITLADAFGETVTLGAGHGAEGGAAGRAFSETREKTQGENMPTEPVEKVLNRDLSRVNARELIDRVCPMLDEIVNYGTNLYIRHAHVLPELISADGAPLLIYLHILEMTDGISELLRESCVAASIPTLRASFEGSLALEYILESDSANRATAWAVGYLSEQLDICDKILGHGKSGQKFQSAVANDLLAADIDVAQLQPIAAVQKPIWEKELSRIEFASALKARAESKKPYPNWYSLSGGPANLRELSAHLKREAQYNVLYSYFSGIAHGQDLRRFTSAAASKNPLSRLVRDSSGLEMVGTLAAVFALLAARLVSERYGEVAAYSSWYTNEIRKRFVPWRAPN